MVVIAVKVKETFEKWKEIIISDSKFSNEKADSKSRIALKSWNHLFLKIIVI